MTKVLSPINLTGSALAIGTSLTINGPGAGQLAISGNNFNALFSVNVSTPGTVSLSGLTLTKATGTRGAVDNGGTGTLTISSCAITNNHSSTGNGGGVSNNNTGVVNVIGSTLSGNTAPLCGGAIANSNGILNITDSTLSNNTVAVTIPQFNKGGGAVCVGGTTNISNTTISGNTAVASDSLGGAISGFGTLNIKNCTITNNSAGSGGGIGLRSGTTQMNNSIVALNSASSGPDVTGTVTATYTLIGDPSGATINGGTGNLSGDPKLRPLANNGGPTQTHLLLPDSPAVDAGDPNFTPPPSNDQRNQPRVAGQRIDMGAVEVSYTLSASAGTPQSTTINTAFSTNLQATVLESGNPVGGVPITFAPPASGPSGVFEGGNPAIATTSDTGIATAPTFVANGLEGTYDVVATASGISTSANFTLTNVALPSPTPSPTPGVVGNVSTRLPVGSGDDVLIEGFIVQGPAGSTKKILVRAIGPSLLPFGVADALLNPTLEIHDSSSIVARNDDWRTSQIGGLVTSDQYPEINASGLAPGDDRESAIIANLAPGSYTAQVRGGGNTTGTGVVDAYDLSSGSPAQLTNIATRGLVQPGDKLMIAGFIVQSAPVRVVVRATGPSLLAFGIKNALPDTTLELHDENGVIIRQNDDWMTDQKAELEATGLQPGNNLEAALVETIPPGQYTAQVRGKPETTGIGVVEVYFLP